MPERPPSQDSAAWVAGAVTSPNENVESGNRTATQLYRSWLEKPVFLQQNPGLRGGTSMTGRWKEQGKEADRNARTL